MSFEVKPLVEFKENSSKMTISKKTIQSIPCRLNYTGAALVSDYFKSETLSNGNEAALFRGHLLYGHQVQLPDDNKIHVLKPRNTGLNKAFKIEAIADSFQAWEHDDEPCPQNGGLIQKSINFLKIAKDFAKNDE